MIKGLKLKFKTERVFAKDLKHGDMVATPRYRGEGVIDVELHTVGDDTQWFLLDKDEEFDGQMVDKVVDEDADLLRLTQ